MVEKDIVFSSNVKSKGIFSFKDLYKFCYDWLSQEAGLDVAETKYAEKLSGDSKELEIKWEGTKKVTDYFKFEIKVKFEVEDLKDVEAVQNGVKIKTNKGAVKISVTGTLLKDYEGKWETSPFRKFMRDIYEKWVITSRVSQYEDKLAGNCDEFLSQVKAYLALLGKK